MTMQSRALSGAVPAQSTLLVDTDGGSCCRALRSRCPIRKVYSTSLSAAEIDNELKNNKTDYWYVKALQAWGLMSVDLRKQISMPRAGMDIKDMRSALNVAAGKFEVELPTKKKDIVHVKMDLE